MLSRFSVRSIVTSLLTAATLVASGCASTTGAEAARPNETSSKGEAAPTKAAKTPAAESATKAPVTRAKPVAPSPILFAYDSSVLTDDGRAALDRMVASLDADDIIAMTIEGHADERGSDAYNLSLGQQRADSIARYLRSKGVPEKRLRSVSYGEHRPAVTGNGEEAWSQNRRGELRVEESSISGS